MSDAAEKASVARDGRLDPGGFRSAGASAPGLWRARATWWSLLGLIGLVAAAYGQTADFALVWDDHEVFQAYPAIRSHVGWWKIFTSPTSAYLGNTLGADRMYRPLLAVTILADRHVWGLHPAGYHLSNALAHLAAVLLLWRLAWWVTGSAWAAFAAGAFLAVHPSAVGAVAFLSARMDVVVGLGMAAVLLLLRGCLGPNGGLRLVGALLCFAAALGSKETAMAIPLMVTWGAWVYPEWFAGPDSQPQPARLAMRVLPFWVLLGLYVVLRWSIIGSFAPVPMTLASLPAQGLRALVALGLYGAMTLIPQPATGDIRLAPPQGLLDGRVLLGLLVVGLLLAGLWWLRRHHPPSALALGWYAAALVPVSNILQIYSGFEVYVVERALYPALMGWCLFLPVAIYAARGALRRVAKGRSRAPSIAFAGAVLGTLLLVTSVKAAAWRDYVSLWTATVVVHPGSAEARIALAAALAQEGRLVEAWEVIQEATRFVPTDAWAAYIQGSIAEQMGARRAALRQYERAIALGKHDELAYSQAALLSARLQEWDRARGWFAAAAERFPRSAWPQVGLGWDHQREGRPDGARQHFARAAELEPGSPERLMFLGNLLVAEGHLADAAQTFQEALRMDPSFLPAQRSLALIAEEEGRVEDAIARWRAIAASLLSGGDRGRVLARIERLLAAGQGNPRRASQRPGAGPPSSPESRRRGTN